MLFVDFKVVSGLIHEVTSNSLIMYSKNIATLTFVLHLTINLMIWFLSWEHISLPVVYWLKMHKNPHIICLPLVSISRHRTLTRHQPWTQ